MINRYAISATLALAITSGLLFLMHVLIEVSEAAMTNPRERTTLAFVRVPIDSPTKTIQHNPSQINPPPPVPTLVAPKDADAGERVLVLGPGPGVPRPVINTRLGLFVSDNALVNIIAVQATYPAGAASRGLEGWVIVQFDVSAAGSVENATVLESSHRVFNKAAVNAAQRFRYKARVVDGNPVASTGVRKLFRFVLEKDSTETN